MEIASSQDTMDIIDCVSDCEKVQEEIKEKPTTREPLSAPKDTKQEHLAMPMHNKGVFSHYGSCK